jgi:hypothetical protein
MSHTHATFHATVWATQRVAADSVALIVAYPPDTFSPGGNWREAILSRVA